MLSVYTRHAEDCKHLSDKLWRRCNCPKWIWGSHNGEFVRLSAKTRFWDDAERLRHGMEFPDTAPPEPEILAPSAPLPPTVALSPAPLAPQLGVAQKPRVTIKAAVNAYPDDAVSRKLAPATISKLETMFRKQFPVWAGIAGLEFIDQVDLDALLKFRNTWKDGRLAKQKKQSRLIGFSWACVRRDYLIKNPSMGLGRIKVGIDDARAILSAMLGCVSTVLALIFSVALLVLSMVANLFGPRLLYRFVQDWDTGVYRPLHGGVHLCVPGLPGHPQG